MFRPPNSAARSLRPRPLAVGFVAFVALSQASCKVGPDYEVPETELPDQWEEAVEAEMAGEETDISRWWEALGDPKLSELIERAELANLDLRFAMARISEARAIHGIARGALYPQVSADGAYTYGEPSASSPQGQAIVGAGGTIEPDDSWSLGAAARWEIDVFGRIRRTVEAAEADFEATIEDFRDVQVTLFADVALNYTEVRTTQARLAYANANAIAQRDSLELTRDRYEAGLTSALDVAQAEQNLAETEAAIPALESRLNIAQNSLAVLLGLHAGALDEELEAGAGELPDAPEDIVMGIPAEVMRRRPDIRRAERILASQTARIGVAEADLYPTFSLDGFVESIAGSAGDLFQSDNVGWSIVPGFRWDLFSGGAIRSNIEAEEARTEQALFSYQQAILSALAEVSDAFVALDRERARRDRLLEAVDASERAVELVRTQYVSGLTNFQNLLDSQRSLFNQQDLLADSEGQVVKNLIVLNRALGGGWSLPPELEQETGEEMYEEAP